MRRGSRARPGAWRLAAYGGAQAVLLYLCLAPTKALPAETLWDKAEHAIAWFVLAAIGLVLWPRRAAPIGAYALAFGAMVEVLQAALPLGRDGDWRDWIADGVGVAAALLAWSLTRSLLAAPRRRRRPGPASHGRGTAG